MEEWERLDKSGNIQDRRGMTRVTRTNEVTMNINLDDLKVDAKRKADILKKRNEGTYKYNPDTKGFQKVEPPNPMADALGIGSIPSGAPPSTLKMQKATQLNEPQEDLFQEWYGKWANQLGINPNPDDPMHQYDYRGAWLNKAEPTWQPEHKQFRWDDRWKLEGHPNLDNSK